MSSPKSVKLHYFEAEGRAEVPRWLLRFAGIPFEDVQYTKENWLQHKNNFPFGAVPVLEVDGVQIPQSWAILLYCASVAGLCPSDPLKLALVNAAIGSVEDFFTPLHKWYTSEGEVRTKLQEEIIKVEIPKRFKMIDAFFASNQSNGYLTGRFSVGDVYLFYFVNSLRIGELKVFAEGFKNWETDFPSLYKLTQQVRKEEGFLKHVKESYRSG